QLDEVARHGELIDYKHNESIARQGERADGFFIVVFGETVVQMVSDRTQISVELATLKPGDFFGEMATLLASERNANVVTSTPKCHVLRFSGVQFKKMLKNLPYFSVGLVQSLAQRLQRTSASKTQTDPISVPAIPVATLRLLPELFCMRHRVLPLATTGSELEVGFVDDPTSEVLEKVQSFVPALRQKVKRLTQAQFDALMRNAVWPGSSENPAKTTDGFDLNRLLTRCITEGASDVHLTTNRQPRWRIDGDLVPIHSHGALSAEQLRHALEDIVPSTFNFGENDERVDIDFAHEISEGERFRVNIYRDMNGLSVAMRHIPSRILSLDQLGAPAVLKTICAKPKGLFLVTGPTGSGKSTTLAAMIDLINQEQPRHIITLEDPIEYRHESARSLVNQREVGVHTQSFSTALRSALREDPDVVLVGEMRDLETVALALEVAQTGHLVFATLHTTSAVGTIERIVGMFDSDKQAQIRDTLADVLLGVVSQTLLRRIGGGRVGAYEVMMSSTAIANLVREMKTVQITSYLSAGRASGNQSLNDDLNQLVARGVVNGDEARRKSLTPEQIVG
ncbi:MAG: PilT/PilU family type 4a pilus ATPase, partial [Bradymonadia bacterium]